MSKTIQEYATPIGNRVLVKLFLQKQITKDGVAIVQTNPVLPIDGVVVSVGNGKKIGVQTGDRVCFDKYAGVEVRLNDEDHIVMFSDEVLGLLD